MDTTTNGSAGNSVVEQLRSRLLQSKTRLDIKFLNSDPILARYLRFNGNNIDKAEKMLNLFAEYHDENGTTNFSGVPFSKELVQDFSFKLGGGDSENRPVIMIPDSSNWSLKKYLEMGEDEMLTKFIQDMTLKARHLCVDGGVDGNVVLVNVANFQYSQYFHRKSSTPFVLKLGVKMCKTRIAYNPPICFLALMFLINFLQLYEKYTPGEIARVIVVNAPWGLKMLFESFKKLVTFSIDVVMYDSNEKKWREEIKKYFPTEGIIQEFGGSLDTYWEPWQLTDK